MSANGQFAGLEKPTPSDRLRYTRRGLDRSADSHHTETVDVARSANRSSLTP
jgi:hypothetical protein